MELPRNNEPRLGWYGRGYLPHFEGGELAQFITFRLHDSLPKEVLIRWKEDLKRQPSPETQSLMRKRVEVFLDRGHGECYLRNHDLAEMVQRNARQFARTMTYIENNPVKANLCEKPEDWPFSSAALRKK